MGGRLYHSGGGWQAALPTPALPFPVRAELKPGQTLDPDETHPNGQPRSVDGFSNPGLAAS
jgi:hypothetical protein